MNKNQTMTFRLIEHSSLDQSYESMEEIKLIPSITLVSLFSCGKFCVCKLFRIYFHISFFQGHLQKFHDIDFNWLSNKIAKLSTKFIMVFLIPIPMRSLHKSSKYHVPFRFFYLKAFDTFLRLNFFWIIFQNKYLCCGDFKTTLSLKYYYIKILYTIYLYFSWFKILELYFIEITNRLKKILKSHL